MKVDGAFQSRAENQMPLFDVTLKADAGGDAVSAGAVSLGDRAFLIQGDTAYRVPQALWTELQESREQIASFAQGSSGGDGRRARPQPALLAHRREGRGRGAGGRRDHQARVRLGGRTQARP